MGKDKYEENEKSRTQESLLDYLINDPFAWKAEQEKAKKEREEIERERQTREREKR